MWLDALIDKLATAAEKLKGEDASPLQPTDIPLTRGELHALVTALDAMRAIRNLVH